MQFREATMDDLDAIARIETVCFPPNEAASRESFIQRLKIYPRHFWLLEDGGQCIGFVNGMVTNKQTISDDMFANAELHNEAGTWQAIFGIAVSPEFRRNGYAAQLMQHLIEKSREQDRAGVILTCKKRLVPYYERFGFVDMGISKSTHGGEVWQDMILRFATLK